MAVPAAPSGLPSPPPDGAAPPGAGDPHRRVLVHARISGLSGLVFAALFVVALVLVRQAPGLGAPDGAYADFYRTTNGDVLVTVGLYVVPFAGVAFLWHMSTTRTLIGALPRSSPSCSAGCTWPRACCSCACSSPAPRRSEASPC